ncbi:MAG: pyridoxal phosphate-dependent aminotransferase [Candidatus Sericytochromatia bacterium]|nr:pyridoxal phosphate-dependent aminotransferase [Candidatus Tanganyikabacteria bacterium]
MDIARSGLEGWFNEQHPGTRHDLGGTMVPAARDRIAALWRPDCLAMGYPPTSGSADLRSLLARHEDLDPGDLVLTCGATEANAAAVLACVEPGREVVLQHPVYYQFEPLLLAGGARIVRWDPFGGEPAPIGPETGLVVLNTPHNPTGRVFDPEGVVRLAEALPSCRVLVDEVYRGVTADAPGTAALLSPRVVATSSFAKRWGMPGLRLGWLACRDAQVRERAHAWHHYLAHSPPAASERLVVALWPELLVMLRESRVLAQRNVGILAAWLAELRGVVEGRPPEGGVTTLVRPTGFAGDDVALALRLRREFGVFVLPGAYVGYPGWLRVGCGHREAADLVAALAALEGAFRAVGAAAGERV